MDYLSDLDDSITSNSLKSHQLLYISQSLRSIKQAFGRLKDSRQRLLLLKESLSSDFSTVRSHIAFPTNCDLRDALLIECLAQNPSVFRKQQHNWGECGGLVFDSFGSSEGFSTALEVVMGFRQLCKQEEPSRASG